MTRPSETFASRLRDVRTRRGWTQQDVSNQLAGLGRPMDRAAIARIEAGERQVSIDDFVSLAAALGVSPVHLIVPLEGDVSVEIAPEVEVSPRQARQWIRGQAPLRATDDPRTFYTEVSSDELQDRYIANQPLLFSLAQGILDALRDAGGDFDDPATQERITDMVEALSREVHRRSSS